MRLRGKRETSPLVDRPALRAAALRNAAPSPTVPGVAGTATPAVPDARYDFSGREAMLGRAMTQLLRTMNHNQSYQHEMNDALVKLTLDHIMFAKRAAC